MSRSAGLLVLLALLVGPAVEGQGRPRPSCADRGASVLVDVSRGQLILCRDGQSTRAFRVAVGRGGGGKAREGDRKTPLGIYSIGEPRASKDFSIFIPIGYPTQEQRRKGATGGDVGIHGPKRGFGWAGGLNTWIDWTRGCIAVSADAEILEIANWVRREKPSTIHIQ